MRLTTNAYLLLAVTVSIAMPALAAENVVRETTQTTTTSTAPPVVLDSYMKPTVEQTKEVTDSNGNTEKTTAPIIMERHEQVAIPNTETRTTTVHEEKQAVEQKVVPHKSSIVRRKTVAHRPRPIRHIAFKKPVHKYVAATPKAVETKAISEDRTVIQQQTVSKPATIIDRKDPALDAQ